MASVESDIVENLSKIGIQVNTKFLNSTAYHDAEVYGDYHLLFTRTWGAPYDPHSYMASWAVPSHVEYSAIGNLQVNDLCTPISSSTRHIIICPSHQHETHQPFLSPASCSPLLLVSHCWNVSKMYKRNLTRQRLRASGGPSWKMCMPNPFSCHYGEPAFHSFSIVV